MMLANLVPVVENYLEAGVRYFIFARRLAHERRGCRLGDLSVPNDPSLRDAAADILRRLDWVAQDYHRGGGGE